MPSLVQKQAGLIRITKKEIIFSNFFVNLEFLFVAPKNEKNTSERQKKSFFLFYFKNNLIGGSPEVKIGIFLKKKKIFNTKYRHFWAKWVITRDYPALHRVFWHLELRYSIINRFRHGGDVVSTRTIPNIQ